MGEAFLVAFLQVLVDKLTYREVFKYFGLIKGPTQKLNKWNDMLIKIEAVVNEAEKRQLTTENKPLRLWLNDLRDLAYDMEDVLDKYATKMLKRQVQYSIPNSVFNFKMNTQIQRITDRLQEICQQKELLGLNNIHTGGSMPYTKAHKNISPSSSQPEGPMIGRDEDRSKIVEQLSKQECQSAVNFDVLAIVGMGGLGKTTLAGQVLNDVKASGMLTPAIWVCVSDDFNLETVTKQILQAITGHSPTEDFNMVQDHLHKKLAGRKFLIVLDDVWETCSYAQWLKLRSPFSDGAPGSKILVTTRDEKVSNRIGATQVYKLKLLTNDACLEIFEHHAFLNANDPRPPNFELLKKKIIEKCNGLPLAARTVGGVCKETDEWEGILNNPMWNLSEESDILPVLRLSYHYLPSHLKRCFAYCSILPNDYEFEENQLILLWMAEGMILPRPRENKKIEDLGATYFRELVSRSLFQKSSNNSLRYVMHDLVSGLARWAAGEICFRLEDMQNDGSVQLKYFPKARHASYICWRYDVVDRFEAFSEVRQLRTFLPISHCRWNHLSRKVTFDLLPKLRRLRVLSLKSYEITELPNTIGKLKYLRYLDLSYTRIRCLPESITTLYNLQTLILEGCSKLKALPAGMSNLINLRHLNNSGVDSLEGMPLQLGRLMNLQSLPKFVVGKGSDHSRIREIGSLLHLGGTLCISRLEDVIDADDATRANLKCKDILNSLMLEWSSSSEARDVESADVLNRLQPHEKLKKLTIRGYCGKEFSRWIRIPSFSNMVCVSLESCKSCILLPSLGRLACLKELYIEGMDAVEIVGPEFYGEANNLPFPLLEILVFKDMQQWKKWLPFGDHDQQGNDVFPCLKELSIRKCPRLEGKLPEKLDSLEKLVISECDELVVSSIAKYKQIVELDIDGCKEVAHTSVVEFELLKTLALSNISELSRFQTWEFMKGLTKVANLEINGCKGLVCSLKNDEYGLSPLQQLISIDHLDIKDKSAMLEKLLGKEGEDELLQVPILGSKLEYVKISRCGTLSRAPKGLHQLASLRELHIYQCPSLVCFPDVGLPPSLQVIQIKECESLLYFAKYEIPYNLRTVDISCCKSLKSLVEEEEEVVGSSSSSCHHICLEELMIWNCPSLASLSLRGSQFPRVLKYLEIWTCEQLQLIRWDGFGFELSSSSTNNSYYCLLESIVIGSCPNLRYLPEGICHPRQSPSLRVIEIYNCDNLEELLPDDMRSLHSLQELGIQYSKCKLGGEGRLTSSWFPPNLTSLAIWKMNSNESCKQLWTLLHLQRLTSLRELFIHGEDPDVVSFPPDCDDHLREKENNSEMVNSMETFLFPKSLTRLTIASFPNLKKLSGSSRKGFQFLTSLQSLQLWDCQKLASIPDEGLPLSLTEFAIYGCPLLAERCQHPSRRAKGRGGCYYSSSASYWPKISHIPRIHIG